MKIYYNCPSDESSDMGITNSDRASCPDYTLWRRQIFDDLSLDELNEMTIDDAEDNPFE